MVPKSRSRRFPVSVLLPAAFTFFLAANVLVSCTFEPAWKSVPATKVVLSFSVPEPVRSLDPMRAIAASAGYAYVQTGLTASEAVMYGPYPVTAGEPTTVTDIPAGTYKAIALVFSPKEFTDPSILPVPDGTLATLSSALATRAAADGLDLQVSCALLANKEIRLGTSTVLAATLMPVTPTTLTSTAGVSLTGSGTVKTGSFVSLVPGFADTSFDLNFSSPVAGTLNSFAVYDAKGVYLQGSSTPVALAASVPVTFWIPRASGSAYFLYSAFTANTLDLTVSQPVVPGAPTTLALNGGLAYATVNAIPLTFVLPTNAAGIAKVSVSGLNCASLTDVKLGGTSVGFTAAASVVTLTAPVTSGGTLELDGALIPAEGAYTVSVALIDTLGRAGTAATATITLDTVAPVVSGPSFASAYTNSTSQTLNFQVQEAGSGALMLNFSGDVTSFSTVSVTVNGSAVTATPTGTTIALAAGATSGTAMAVSVTGVLLSSGDGNKSVSVSVGDVAGNESSALGSSVVLDTTMPVITALNYSGYPFYDMSPTLYVAGTTIEVIPTADDGSGSGIQGYSESPSGPWYTSVTCVADGGSHVIYASDYAGNTTATNLTVVQDTAPPVLSGLGGSYPLLQLTVDEAGAGIAYVDVQYAAESGASVLSGTYTGWTYTSLGDAALNASLWEMTTGAQTANSYVYFKIVVSDFLGNIDTYYFYRFYDGSSETLSAINPTS